MLFSLILLDNNEPFLSRIVICNEKWILYDNQWYHLSGLTEKKLQSTSQSLTCTEKRSWSLFGGLLRISDPLQFAETWWNHYIWEICPANRYDAPKTATPAIGFGPKKGLNFCQDNTWPLVTQPILQKLNKVGCEVLPFLPYSPDFLLSDYHFLKKLRNVLQEKCFHNQ